MGKRAAAKAKPKTCPKPKPKAKQTPQPKASVDRDGPQGSTTKKRRTDKSQPAESPVQYAPLTGEGKDKFQELFAAPALMAWQREPQTSGLNEREEQSTRDEKDKQNQIATQLYYQQQSQIRTSLKLVYPELREMPTVSTTAASSPLPEAAPMPNNETLPAITDQNRIDTVAMPAQLAPNGVPKPSSPQKQAKTPTAASASFSEQPACPTEAPATTEAPAPATTDQLQPATSEVTAAAELETKQTVASDVAEEPTMQPVSPQQQPAPDVTPTAPAKPNPDVALSTREPTAPAEPVPDVALSTEEPKAPAAVEPVPTQEPTAPAEPGPGVALSAEEPTAPAAVEPVPGVALSTEEPKAPAAVEPVPAQEPTASAEPVPAALSTGEPTAPATAEPIPDVALSTGEPTAPAAAKPVPPQPACPHTSRTETSLATVTQPSATPDPTKVAQEQPTETNNVGSKTPQELLAESIPSTGGPSAGGNVWLSWETAIEHALSIAGTTLERSEHLMKMIGDDDDDEFERVVKLGQAHPLLSTHMNDVWGSDPPEDEWQWGNDTGDAYEDVKSFIGWLIDRAGDDTSKANLDDIDMTDAVAEQTSSVCVQHMNEGNDEHQAAGIDSDIDMEERHLSAFLCRVSVSLF